MEIKIEQQKRVKDVERKTELACALVSSWGKKMLGVRAIKFFYAYPAKLDHFSKQHRGI